MFGSEPSHSAKIALEKFKKNNVKHIIELGAGLGRDTIFFAKNSIKVTALDYSPTAVEIIKNKSNSLGLNDLIEVQTHDLRQKLNFTLLGLNSGGASTSDTWQTTNNVLDTALTTWKIVYNGSDVSFYQNGVLIPSSRIVSGNVVNMTTSASASLGQRASSSGDISADVSDLKVYNDTTTYLHVPLSEGSGSKVYDVSGNGNHGLITGAAWATLDNISSWNHEYGFDTDKFKGYSGYWDLANSASGTWTISESSLSLTGNSGSSSRIRQTVDMDIGASLVVSGTVVQTGGNQGGEDLAISSSSVGWAEGSVFLGGSAGTYTFSTSFTAIAAACDIQFIGLNGVTLTISDIKFTVVKKVPALNFKSTQVATFDGASNSLIASGITGDSVITNDGTAVFNSFPGFAVGTAGTAYNIRVDGVLTFTMSDGIGTTTVPSVNPAIGDATVAMGAGGLDSFWGTRIADTSGLLVSADYSVGNLTISNPASLDNGSEVDLIQTDSVFVSGATNFWSANGSTQDEKTFAQLIDHANNRNGYDRIWVKVVAGRVICIAQYELDTNFTPSDVLKNERYFGGTSGALRDVNGDLIVDGSGFVIFAA